jgi:hypothetical protein
MLCGCSVDGLGGEGCDHTALVSSSFDLPFLSFPLSLSLQQIPVGTESHDILWAASLLPRSPPWTKTNLRPRTGIVGW